MRWRFGECVVDGSTRQLFRGADAVRLSPKALELLLLLLERAPAAVPKDEIIKRVWSGTYISDASLTNVVAEIRRAIGDSRGEARFLRTVHAYGYAFCGEIAGNARAPEPPAWRLLVSGRPRLLISGANVLGRDAAATVVIDHSSVSRRHARVLVRETGAFIEDLQSRNGTFVNGKAIDGPTELHDGDVVALGPVSLVIERISSGGSTETAPQQ